MEKEPVIKESKRSRSALSSFSISLDLHDNSSMKPIKKRSESDLLKLIPTSRKSSLVKTKLYQKADTFAVKNIS